MGIIGYKTEIHITEVLPIEEQKSEYYQNTNASWLFSPFLENITYGTSFSINSGFTWKFFLYAETYEKADELGNAFLFYLQEKFKGLNGKIDVFPVFSESLEIERSVYEIIIPSYISLKFPFLRKLINYYKSPHRKIGLNMFIFWKRDDLGTSNRPSPDPWSYRIKIFISFDPNNENFTNFNTQPPEIKTVLRYLIAGTQKGKYKELLESKWKYILTCNVFPSKEEFSSGEIPNEEIPKIIKPENVDFTIPKDMPLPNPPILENRNIINSSISKGDEDYVYFGYKMIDGVISKEIAALKIDSLNNHLDIYGKTGKGKSTLIKIIIQQLRRKRPDVGILIINLADPNLAREFPTAKVYDFPSEKLKIPYILIGNRAMKSMRCFGNAIAAGFGLKYVAPVLINETLQRIYYERGKFPMDIRVFFNELEGNLKAKPYSPKFQQDLLVAFRHRIGELFSDYGLRSTLSLKSEAARIHPDWLSEFRNGNLVLLNLTEGDDIKEQPFLTMLILNMLEIAFHSDSSNVLKNLIFLDEAHRAVGKSRDKDPESVEFIMKDRINALFSNTIEECRKKGLGIVKSEQKPSLLLDTAIDSAEIKILFGLGYPNNEIFTGNASNREMLSNLKPRHALVLNDLTGERYLCKIVDEEEVNT